MADESCGECDCWITDEGYSAAENDRRAAAFDAGTMRPMEVCTDWGCECHTGRRPTAEVSP